MDPIESTPTLQGFTDWVYTVMGIPTTALAPDDAGFAYAFQVALEMVPQNYSDSLPTLYVLTVYNWGGSQLIQFQQDYPGQTYFASVRKGFGVNSFVAGVVNNAADATTSEALTVGKGLQNLDLISLQRIKDPYGRQAIAYMQSLGTLWGLS